MTNNNGIALIIVMLVLSLSVVIISVLMYILNAESRMVNNYASKVKADQIAEAAADLAISQWILFNTEKDDSATNLEDRLEQARKPIASKMQGKIIYTLNYNAGTLEVDIEGIYNGEVTTTQVFLRYENGEIKVHKGKKDSFT